MEHTRKYSLGTGLCVHADGAEIQEHINALIARVKQAKADLARIRPVYEAYMRYRDAQARAVGDETLDQYERELDAAFEKAKAEEGK
jgi:hypothetical protein